MPTNERIGRRIAAARAGAGISQAELARRLDVSRTSVANWETGVSCPHLKTLLRMADVLGCGLDELAR